MTNSSSVGITKTRILAASVEMSPVTPKTFFSSSTSQPNHEIPEITSRRKLSAFSPTPAVKTMASAPFSTARY
ncbi:Uncharacterised protein [Streptococcus pneumoniae]|nr:Uncharacterised protein [Streptococcus pneumoniae]